MEKYKTIHYVKYEDLTIHGTLYAARGMTWFTEAAFASAALAYSTTKELLLIGASDIKFKNPIPLGDIVSVTGQIVRTGRTSFTVAVTMASEFSSDVAIEGYATFVTVDDETGEKKPHGITLDETDDEEELIKRSEAGRI